MPPVAAPRWLGALKGRFTRRSGARGAPQARRAKHPRARACEASFMTGQLDARVGACVAHVAPPTRGACRRAPAVSSTTPARPGAGARTAARRTISYAARSPLRAIKIRAHRSASRRRAVAPQQVLSNHSDQCTLWRATWPAPGPGIVPRPHYLCLIQSWSARPQAVTASRSMATLESCS